MIRLTTIYIDVYFLINFTVDLLAIYFSCVFSKINCGIRRMLIAALLGGSYAVIFVLFLDNSIIMYPISLVILLSIIFIVAYKTSFLRKIRYAVSFILFQLVIGGIVYYGYCALSTHIPDEFIDTLGNNNKKLLILAILVLMAIGIIKIILAFFVNAKSEIVASVEISFNNKTEIFDALVDSGNLLKDPFDKKPVMLITVDQARRFIDLPRNVEDYDSLTCDLKKRIRIIPITRGENTRILYGIKADKAFYINGKKRENIDITIAIDTEECDYGGYFALIPLSALEGII